MISDHFHEEEEKKFGARIELIVNLLDMQPGPYVLFPILFNSSFTYHSHYPQLCIERHIVNDAIYMCVCVCVWICIYIRM
jgi:hypothetical protein